MGWQDDQIVSQDWRNDQATPGAPAAAPSSEDPGLSATPPVPGADPVDSALHAGARGAQAFRESLYNTASMPGNAAAWLMKQAGLRNKDAPSPQQGPTIFDKEPETPLEKGAAYVGGAAGDVASTVLPFSLAGRAGKAVQVGEKLASMEAPSLGREIAKSIVAKPGAQTALTAGGNAAADQVMDSGILPPGAAPYVHMLMPFALGGAAHAGQRAFNAAPAATTQEAERRALLQYGKEIGGTNTAGTITGNSKLQTLESANSKLPLPFVGGRVDAAHEANRNAFQAEALRKAGDTSGATAAPPNVTQEVRAKLGDKFNFLTGNNELKVDPQFGEDLAKAKDAFSQQLESQMPKDVRAKLDELATAPKDAIIDGKTYQNIRSKLSAQLSNASGTDKQAIGGMIDALDGLAERTLPKETVGDFKEARQQWRNLLAVEKAVGSANNPETAKGNIPTAAYMRASRGNPDIERLGRYGGAMVGDKAGNPSGTAKHMGVTHLMGALAGAYEGFQHAPGATLGAIGAATLPFAFEGAANNPATRAWLMRRLQNPSQSVIGSPTFGALAGQQLLKQGQ